MKRFPFLFFLLESPTRANFVSLDINSAVTVTVYVSVCVCESLPFLPLLTSFTCYDRSSFSPPVHSTLNSSHYFSSGRKRRRKKDIEHFFSLPLSLSLFLLLSMYRSNIFESFFSYILSKWNAKRPKIAVRTCASAQLIKDVRTKQFLYVYIHLKQIKSDTVRQR
jgi:hypothetical protein